MSLGGSSVERVLGRHMAGSNPPQVIPFTEPLLGNVTGL